ncbi:MAG: LamG-like jellyroll fold domain-containing protein [Candidatus Gracilibacteria bacterium]|nr:LamG-like jellyroll fold domain-containing protein [Candidatus Gracilibacteria bacterium]
MNKQKTKPSQFSLPATSPVFSGKDWTRIRGGCRPAFTLVELIVVITILAILGTIAFISLQGYSKQARDSTRISDLSKMKTSLELFQIETGKYPLPTNGINITYSGATVWTQGTFGDTVIANIVKLDVIPRDILTEKEYTYSITSSKNQYELGGIIEGDEVSYRPPLTPPYQGGEQAAVASSPLTRGELRGVFAGTIEAQAYTTGNYNGQMTKSLSGELCNVLALPTIITNDTNITDLQQIVTEQKLVYRGFKNLPASFKGSKFNEAAGFDFQPNTLLAYTDTSSCTPLTDNSSYTARVNLLKGLKDAYIGTILQNEGELANIVNLEIDTNSPSNEVINYAGNYVNNVLKGKVSTSLGGTTTTTYANCDAKTQSGYTIPQINHSQSENITKSGSISNGTQNYGAQANCIDGTLNIIDEAINIVCNGGYVEQSGACVADQCLNTVPLNAHSTATSQNVNVAWIHNSTTPGVCTFACDTNYSWNGSSCTTSCNHGENVVEGQCIDPDWSKVSMLMRMNGTNNSTNFLDSKGVNVITRSGDTKISTENSMYDGASGFFDGNNDFITYTYNASLYDLSTSDFTLEGWINPSAYAGGSLYGTILSKRTGGADFDYTLFVAGSTGKSVCFKYGTTSNGAINLCSSNNSILLNTWYHVAVTREGSSLKLFIDGNLVNTNTLTENIRNRTTNVEMGKSLSYTDSYFHGYIDEFRITKGKARYTSSFTKPTKKFAIGEYGNKTLLMHFDGANNSTSYIDEYGHNFTNFGNAKISSNYSKFGGTSLYTNYTNGYIHLTHNDLLIGNQPFTMEYWFLQTHLPSAGYGYAIQTYGNGSDGTGGFATQTFQWNTGSKGHLIRNAYGTILRNYDYNIGQWYHFAITRETVGGNIRFYVDGVSLGYLPSSGNFGTTNYLKLGHYTGSWNQVGNIYIDELRFIKGESIYNGNFTPPTQAFTK